MRTLTAACGGCATASNCVSRAPRTLCAAPRAGIARTRTAAAVMASRGAALLLGARYGSLGSATASARRRKLDALLHWASASPLTRSHFLLQKGDSARTSGRETTVRKAVSLGPSDGRYRITSTHQLSSELERPCSMDQSINQVNSLRRSGASVSRRACEKRRAY